MADNAIASGSVIITANADRLHDGLKQTDKEVKHWSKGLASGIGDELATELGKRGFAGGVLGGIIGGGLGGAISEVVANTLGELGVTDLINRGVKGFFSWVSGAEQTREAVAKITAELKAAGDEQDRILADASKWRATLVDQPDKVADINSKLDQLSAQWNEMDDRAKSIGSELQQVERRWGLLTNRSRRLDQIEAIIAAQNEIVKKMDVLRAERETLTDPTKNIELVGGIAKATIGLREQAASWGLSGDAAQRATFKFRGATDAMLAQFDAQRKINEELTETNSLFPSFVFMLSSAAQISREMTGQALPGFNTMLGTLGRVAGALPKPAGLEDWVRGALDGPQGNHWLGMVLGAATSASGLLNKMNPSSLNNLAGAVEAGTAEGYSLSVRNKFGGMDGAVDVNKQNGVKLDAIRMSIQDGFKKIEDSFRGVGIL